VFKFAKGSASTDPTDSPVVNPNELKNPVISFSILVMAFSGPKVKHALVIYPLVNPKRAILNSPNASVPIPPAFGINTYKIKLKKNQNLQITNNVTHFLLYNDLYLVLHLPIVSKALNPNTIKKFSSEGE